MKITLLPARQLSPDLVGIWSQLQEANAALDSPFFRPEFTQAVTACRDDVEVAVLEQDGRVAGFFPFQRSRLNVGKPVGGRMSDFHGVVAGDDLALGARELVRGCRLAAWDFHHLVASQELFASHCWEMLPSPYMDLSAGFAAYYREHRKKSTLIENTLRKTRKLEREVGPLRFVPRTTESAVLDQMIAWKREQYRRTGVTDIFAYDWTVNLLRRIVAHENAAFSGSLSALCAGDQLMAVEMDIRSGPVLHGWFHAYNPGFAPYSPGMVLILQVAQAAQALGIRRIEMCSGPAAYKNSLMSGVRFVASGSVACNLTRRLARTCWRYAKCWARLPTLRTPARVAGRFVRPLRGWLAFR